MAGVGGIAGRLYRGEVSINFVGRQRLWYAISGVILLVSVVALLVRGLNFSLEFKGGSSFTFPADLIDQPGRDLPGGERGGRRRRDRAVRLRPVSCHQWTVQTGTLTSRVDPATWRRALEQAFDIAPEQHVDPARRPDLGRPDHLQGRSRR